MDFISIENVQNKHTKIDLHGYLKQKAQPRDVNTKSGPTQVCDVTLYDDTGEITLALWGDDITEFHDGDQVEITNGYTKEFNGKISLNVGKYGTIKKLE